MRCKDGIIIISPDELWQKVTEILLQYNVKKEHAEIVAETLVEAEIRGVKSHGINMLEAYLARISQGGININANPVIIRDRKATALIDAQGGFGQVAGKMAVDLAVKKASEHSISWIGVRRSNHCGMLAYYTEKISQAGFIGVMLANANPTVAPFGGMEAVLGTNPFSIAIPTEAKPIILDMATSNVAKAKIYRAKELNERIDPEWALDENGYPTDDPAKAINGVLTPLGGPKGYGLALAVDVLAGLLNGSGFAHYVKSVHKKVEESQNAGLTVMAVSIEALTELENYYQKINELITFIKESKPRPGYSIYLPGELEELHRRKVEKEGIQIDINVWNKVFTAN